MFDNIKKLKTILFYIQLNSTSCIKLGTKLSPIGIAFDVFFLHKCIFYREIDY